MTQMNMMIADNFPVFTGIKDQEKSYLILIISVISVLFFAAE
jgi:hypothetical protein